MRLRNVKDANLKLESSPYYIKDPSAYKGTWHNVNLEVGCGKGSFLIAMAKNNPDKTYIGIEKYPSVLVRAIEKANNLELDNIHFMCFDASNINEYFTKEVDTIYLNFSDPWPKERHKKRRLTSPDYLSKYDLVFKGLPHIIQKTDNIILFGYSLEQLSKHGYTLEKVSLDLANSNIPNFPTEYETKFTSLGYKINYVDAIDYGSSLQEQQSK